MPSIAKTPAAEASRIISASARVGAIGFFHQHMLPSSDGTQCDVSTGARRKPEADRLTSGSESRESSLRWPSSIPNSAANRSEFCPVRNLAATVRALEHSARSPAMNRDTEPVPTVPQRTGMYRARGPRGVRALAWAQSAPGAVRETGPPLPGRFRWWAMMSGSWS